MWPQCSSLVVPHSSCDFANFRVWPSSTPVSNPPFVVWWTPQSLQSPPLPRCARVCLLQFSGLTTIQLSMTKMAPLPCPLLLHQTTDTQLPYRGNSFKFPHCPPTPLQTYPCLILLSLKEDMCIQSSTQGRMVWDAKIVTGILRVRKIDSGPHEACLKGVVC